MAGVRKILLPPRRAGCFALSPDCRLGLACCSVVSVLRTSCIGASIGSYGGSATANLETSIQRMLSAASGGSIPMSLYPAVVGHQFVCSVVQDGKLRCGLVAPSVCSSASAVVSKPSICDVRYISWGPISHGSPLFVVSGSGRLHLLKSSSLPVGTQNAREEGDVERKPGVSVDNGVENVADAPVVAMQTNNPSVDVAQKLPLAPVTGVVGEASTLSASSPAAVSHERSETLTIAEPLAGDDPARDPKPSPPDVVAASDKVFVSSQNDRELISPSELDNWLWEPSIFPKSSSFCTFPPPHVTCVESITLGCESLERRVDSGADESVVLIAIGTSEDLGLWIWEGEGGRQPELCSTLHEEMTGALSWLSFPGETGPGGHRLVGNLASGLQGVVKVYRVGCVVTKGSNLVFTDLVWTSSSFSRGVVTCLSWWWGVSKTQGPKASPAADGSGPEAECSDALFHLKLGASAFNSTFLFRWTCLADGEPLEATASFESHGWARKAERRDFIFSDARAGIGWTTCSLMSVEKNERHGRVVSAVRFMFSGELVSSSEDGQVIAWSEGHGDVENQGKHSGFLSRNCVIVDMPPSHPVLGLTALNLRLCLAVNVAVPDSEETTQKTHTSLLGKFRASARLGRIMVVSPVSIHPSGVSDFVKSLVSNLLESVQTGCAAISCDFDFWLKEQSPEVAGNVLEVILEALVPLQRVAVGLSHRDSKVCAQVYLCLARAVSKHGKAAGKNELVQIADEIIPELCDVLLYSHCSQAVETAFQLFSDPEASGGAELAQENIYLDQLSRFEVASLYSTSLFILSSGDDIEESEAGGSYAKAKALANKITGNMEAAAYQLPCPVCEFEEEDVDVLLSTTVENIGKSTICCAQGDEFVRCALTMVPATESILLVCTGCRNASACDFLSTVKVHEYVEEGEEEEKRQQFPWLIQQNCCPFCAATFQRSTVSNETYGTALP